MDGISIKIWLQCYEVKEKRGQGKDRLWKIKEKVDIFCECSLKGVTDGLHKCDISFYIENCEQERGRSSQINSNLYVVWRN